MVTGLLFYVFAAVLVVAALGVITARNPVHSALFLVLAFVQSAVMWLLIEAEFLAIALVLVYVGAVMVLFLFVVMMLDINVEELRKGFTRYLPLGVAVALVVVVEIGHVVWFRAPRARVRDGAEAVARGLQQHEGARRGAVHAARLRVRDRGRDTAARDRRGHHADDAPPAGSEGAGHLGAGGRAAPRTACASSRSKRARSADAHDHHSTLLVLAAILFSLSVAGIFINRKNVILL